MSLTVTLHVWWLLAYLMVGVVLYVPLYRLSFRHVHNPRATFWAWFLIMHHKDLRRIPWGVVLWPFMVKEAL